jgi:hypothetical protein
VKWGMEENISLAIMIKEAITIAGTETCCKEIGHFQRDCEQRKQDIERLENAQHQSAVFCHVNASEDDSSRRVSFLSLHCALATIVQITTNNFWILHVPII